MAKHFEMEFVYPFHGYFVSEGDCKAITNYLNDYKDSFSRSAVRSWLENHAIPLPESLPIVPSVIYNVVDQIYMEYQTNGRTA